MNNQIFYFFYNLAHRSQALDQAIIFFAVYFPFLVAALALLFLIFYHYKWKEIIIVFFSGIVAYVCAYILKFLFHTLRPFLALPDVHALFFESGYAFPSGHATFFTALAFLIYFYNKKAGYTFMFFALIIGLARITAGVHFPVDILGGFILGGLVAYFVKTYIMSI
jgi:undecaprenyl-diphosphatase